MCAYKPPTVKIGDLKGIAKVQFSKDHEQVRIVFLDEKVWGRPIQLTVADALPNNLNESGEYFLAVNSERTQVRQWRPANAMVKAVVQKFVAKKDSQPTPMTNPTYGNRYFQVVFEIVEPAQYKGCTIANTYQYFFTEVVGGNGKSIVGLEEHPKSKYMKPLVDLLDYTGVWEKGAIAYSDNILPTLERRMKNANKVVMFAIKDGWIDAATFESADANTPKEEPEIESTGEEPEDETQLQWE